MSENDQYPTRRGGSKKPVTVLLMILLVAGIAVVLYETKGLSPSNRAGAPAAVPSVPNPNTLVPGGSGGSSPTPP